MLALKVMILAVTVLAVNTSPATDSSNQSPSNPTQLPSDQTRSVQPVSQREGQRDEKPRRVKEAGKQTLHEAPEPHRLSKRFISPRWSLKRSGHSPKASLVGWSADGETRLPIDLSLSSRLPYYDPANDPYISDLLGYDKPKRFIGLLPAKEPRRKDLPPRLGEESAPKFARAFSFPDDPEDFPSVRATLSGLLRKLKNLHRYGGDVPTNYMDHRHLLAQSFRIDTPININHVDFSFGIEDNMPVYSNIDSADYSSSGTRIADGFDQESSSSAVDENDEFGDFDQEGSSASRKADLAKFKESLHKLISHIQEISQVEESRQT